MAASDSARLAVLIDADNAQAALADALLAEIATYGVASVKRVYGDWTLPNLRGWKDVLTQHAIQPVQQFRYTVGKNATDGAMIIDAMDLLHSKRFDGFCIVSSDSDFTGLAQRIRADGLTVYGFGERKTPQAFVSACDKFIFVDVLRNAPVASGEAPKERMSAKELRRDARLLQLVRDGIDAASDEDGWANLGPVGSYIVKQAPEFDPRNWGYGKLGDLVTALGLFEIDRQKAGDGRSKSIRLRDKRQSG
ncbi:MAG TPA: NYN domain-containing protein [Nevskiaceae bacterium]|nr:NYN domain-containing protein [Nevskiaceae bacterium]